MSKDFFEAIEARRSYYDISNEALISEEQLEHLVKRTVRTMPSPMNSQSARVLLLLNEQHDTFWRITMEALRKRVPVERFAATEKKINGFAAGQGTLLYFDETQILKELQEKYPTYKDNFPVWGQHANAMLQFALWTALEAEGYGASLQHYTEVVEDQVREEWDISPSWKLIAQMPFGKPLSHPGEKHFEPIEKRVIVHK